LSSSVSTIVPSAATELASPHTFAMSSFRYALMTSALARPSFSLVKWRMNVAPSSCGYIPRMCRAACAAPIRDPYVNVVTA
jgi:hypothetical protein